MPDKPPPDPFAVWRDMVSQWEKTVNAAANKNMASDEFSGSMNQVMNVMLKGQQGVGEVMVKYLATLNLPSRQDLLALGEQLGSIESQLNRIALLLERQGRHSTPVPGRKTPPRTKRPAPPRTTPQQPS
jgi:hypothetical protein